MRAWLRKILVPALVVGAAAVQSIGIDAGRAARAGVPEELPDSIVARRDSIRAVQDSILAAKLDSLRIRQDSILSAREAAAAPVIDSLRPIALAFESRLDTADTWDARAIRRSYKYKSVNWQLAILDVRNWFRDSIFIDSVRSQIDSFGYDAIDSAILSRLDSLELRYTEPEIQVRDTLVIPAGLDTLDPFKFKYYLAIKDTTEKKHVRDSLLAIPDSAEVARLDSLYLKDSTEVAQWREMVYYNSLSRRDKKKYDYEKALPGKMHRMDSITHRKDSIKAYKDSVKENTPRILETYVLADSLQYKRIITWHHDRKFNDIRLYELDTTYNYHFHDYPFYKADVNASYLGMSGSAVQLHNWFKRTEEDNVEFYSPYQLYSYSPQSLPMYNTKTPYTELAYWGNLFTDTQKAEDNIKILTTQNITPELNLTLEYHRYGGKGQLQNESTDNRTAVIATNYMGKKYLMHAGYIYNKVGRGENGGVQDIVDGISLLRDTTVKDVREVDVRMKDASSLIKKNTFFLDQSYRIPFNFLSNRKQKKAEKAYRDSLMASGDSLAIAEYLESESEKSDADTLIKDVTSAFIGHTSEFSTFKRLYNDKIGTSDRYRDIYENYFFNPTVTADSMRVMRLENRVFLRLQPWKSDGVVSKLDVGVGDKFLTFYDFTRDNYLGGKGSVRQNSMYVYAGAQGQYRKYLRWSADGKYNFLGSEINDFSINADLELSFYPFRRHKDSPLNILAHFETSLREPGYYQQHIHLNHFQWDNDFGKISTTKVEAALDIPRWKLRAEFGYGLLNNNIYYDCSGVVRQNGDPMSVITASLKKDFTFWKIHLDNLATLQFSSNEEVMPLPLLSLNSRLYFQFDVVKKVMQMQIGADGWYHTKWYAPAWNPEVGVFHNQNLSEYGNCLYLDAFVNVQWKRACIFLKCTNVNMGWPWKNTDYFSAHNFIRPVRSFKVGIFWPFYIQPGRNKGGSAGDLPGDSSGGNRLTSGGGGGGLSAGGGRQRSAIR